METTSLLEATIAVGDPFDTTRSASVMVTEDTTQVIRADLCGQFRRGLGNVFLRVDSEGLAHRIDPDAVTAVEANDGSGGPAGA